MNLNDSSEIISNFAEHSKNRTIKQDKKMKHYLFRIALLCVLQTFILTQLHAQFCIVDAEDGKPLAGVYLYDENTNCIAVSDKNGKVGKLSGKVTASLMGYEAVTVDASTFTGKIELKSKWTDLPELVVKKKDYAKMTGVFRDIFRNNGSTVIYREGIVDFYFSKKKQKFIRRVRACRQWEMNDIRKPSTKELAAKNISLWGSRSTDLSKLKFLDTPKQTDGNGDTTIYQATYKGKELNGAIMKIKMPKLGLMRHVIDNSKLYKDTLKYGKRTYITKQNISDWTMRDESSDTTSISSIIAIHTNFVGDFQFDKESEPIGINAINDFVVTGIEYLTNEEAKKDLKNKEIKHDFKMPDVLPEINFNREKETKNLLEADFWEY